MKMFRLVTGLLSLSLASILLTRRLHAWLRLLLPEASFSLVLLAYLAVLLPVVFAFSRIRTRADYRLKAFGAYGMSGFVALCMTLTLTALLPLATAAEAVATLALALVYLIYGLRHATVFQRRCYAVPLLDEPLSIVLVSDLHIGAVGSEKNLPRLVRRINAEDPDLIVMAGDLFDNFFPSIVDPDAACEALRSLRAKHGVYACLGNHDAGESAADMRAFAARCGITVLQEEYAVIAGRLVLLGRLDALPHGGYGGALRQETSAVLARNPQPQLPLVVLEHNPAAVRQYDTRTALVLCGHTHNGQLFPANLLLKRLYECSYGFYPPSEARPAVVVTSGAGYWGMPLRVGTDCEIVRIELKNE